MSVDMDQVLGFLAQLVVVGGGVAAIYWGVKKWVGDIADNTKETAKQLETSNGHTVGHYVEDTASKLDELAEVGRENRTLIEHVSDRLDAHLKGHN